MDVLQQFPIRKSKRQKTAFLDAATAYCCELGYQVQVEKGGLGVRNLVIGDPKSADYLITAHYDTCARLPFPNLLTPCSFWLFAAWQLLLVVVLCVPVGVIAGVTAVFLDAPELGGVIAYVLLLAELAWMMVGPANQLNANDNTSGVVTVLETASRLKPADRNRVCFVLFDLEEAGLLGSSAYRKKHRKESAKQLVLNADCVGEGNEILLFPTGKLKKNRNRMDRLQAACLVEKDRSMTLVRKGFAIYPSDQANFPLGLGIAAFRRSAWAGLYLGKIHTKRDVILEQKNVALICDFLLQVISHQA